MKKMLLAAALAWLAPAALLAQEDPAGDSRPPRGEDMFKRWDSNGDGVISRDEAQAAGAGRIAKKFDSLDKDKDGQLTPDELRAARDDRMAAMKERFDTDFRNADKNGDGSLTKEEAAGMPMLARHFDEVDTNKDGVVTREEIEAHHAKMGPRGAHRGGRSPSPQS